MADTKSSALTALTGANLNAADLFMGVDVSDTTMAASGTNKKITAAELLIGLAAISAGVTIPTGLTLAAGTLTTDVNVLSITGTWNAAGVTFTGIKANFTNTASNAASLLADIQLGGSSKFAIGITSSLLVGSRAANTVSISNGTTGQSLYLDNTYSDSSNYERGFMRYSSNQLQIGSEAAGTGTARAVQLYFGGSKYLDITLASVEWSKTDAFHYFKGCQHQGLRHALTARTANLSLDVDNNCNHVLTNTGASGEVIFTLPTSEVGAVYRFGVTAAQYLQVKAPTSAVIYNGSAASASAGYIRSNTIGSSMTLVCVAANTWHCIGTTGTWTIDS